MEGQTPEESRVRAIWRAFAEGGIEAVLPMLAEDVRWRPFGDDELVVEGREGVREFLTSLAREGRRLSFTVGMVECRDDRILVRGRQREDAPGRIADDDVWWVCQLRDGLLARAETYLSRPLPA